MSDYTPYQFKSPVTLDDLRGFLVDCYHQNVSDIHLIGGTKITVSRYGRLLHASQVRLENSALEQLLNQLIAPEIQSLVKKGQGTDRALQLEGDSHQRYGLARGERVRFRCNIVQATVARLDMATSATLRILPNTIPSLASLNLENDLFDALIPHKGLGLVCGETGSGKSTLLAAIYQYCNTHYPDKKIVTYEDPVEYILGHENSAGIPPIQCQIGRDIPSFAEGLRMSLRQAPDVIGVGEMRDLETIEGAITNAKSGHLCLSTMHTNSPGETIPRAVMMFPAEQRDNAAIELLNVMQYIIVQRLLKTTDGKRVAVREYCLFDDALKNELLDTPYKEWTQRINNNVIRITDKALALYEQGMINQDEIIEVMGKHAFTQRGTTK